MVNKIVNPVHNSAYPLVSIGIPTYNGNQSILNALSSAWAQNYPNLEVIISDNASTDETQSMCLRICHEHPEVRYFRHSKNIGMHANFEFALNQARGKYFMWLADDDRIESRVLWCYVNFLQTNPAYSLVSGRIQYWLEGKKSDCEYGFTFEQKSPSRRLIQYYSKVVHGAMFHGLMRREIAQEIGIRRVIGNDWHFVSSMAYKGKIKNFNFVGYHKKFGGTSRSFKQYAQLIGESSFAGRFPRLKIARDAFYEIMTAPMYQNLPMYFKLQIAFRASIAVLSNYYLRLFPFIIGGKIKRFIKSEVLAKEFSVQQ